MSPPTSKATAEATGDAAQASTSARRTQQERSSQAEHALLDAAATLFAQRGVDQTSLADIGGLAGYSRGLANHHFGTKATLIERLARRTQADFVASVDDVATHELDALVEVTDKYLSAVERGNEVGRAFVVMWGAAIPSEAPLRPVFAVDDAQFRLAVATMVRSGQAVNTVSTEVDPELGAVMFVGLLRGVAAQYFIDPDAFDMEAARRACQASVRRIFAPAAGRVRTRK
jgi:AcrR family transcriptional regulator